NEYQVLEGLNPGDTIITSGLLNLRDGVPIDPEAGVQGDTDQASEGPAEPSADPTSKGDTTAQESSP
ncbi:MAG: hypothetical protein ABG776_05810, partial [Cyanobacteria bacterium J06555_13]